MVCYQSDPSSSCPNMCQHTFLASESTPAIFTHTSFRLLSHLLKEKVLFDIALVSEVKRPSLQFKLLTPDSDIELFIPTANGFAKKIYQELGHGNSRLKIIFLSFSE